MSGGVRDLVPEREVSLDLDPAKVWHGHRVVSCAQCREPMTTRTVEGVEIDECPECGVFWFDQGELGALIEARTSTTLESLGPHRAPLDRRERCAVCLRGTDVFRLNHVPHVAVDVCTEHGNWLDEWQGRELYLWGCKDAAQAEAARTTPYQRRLERLRTSRGVWIAMSMYGLKSAAMSTHSVFAMLVMAFWFKDLAELLVDRRLPRRDQ